MSKNKLLQKFMLIDTIPAISGLIGKTALVTSFAVIWAAELKITNPDFVFENVRIEIIIGSIITLIAALIWRDVAPSGTLAPFVTMIPTMVAFGVHPFILSIGIGITGIFAVQTKLFSKLLALSGPITKVSLTITFGVSGVIMSIRKLYVFFYKTPIALYLILLLIFTFYLLLLKWHKLWLIIPTAAITAILISLTFGFQLIQTMEMNISLPSFYPVHWWRDMWGIGFGLNLYTIIKTLPFALFVLLLWAIDTVSITTMLDANYGPEEKKEEINLNRSFLITSLRNMLGGTFGGAQTGALWRSFLIPLFTIKRPLQPASILLGIFGIIAGITAIPLRILSFPPLIWSVLLFGIFLPLLSAGIKNLAIIHKSSSKLIAIVTVLFGISTSPIITWICTVLYEKVISYKKEKAPN